MKPIRTFSADVGQTSIDNRGPDAIENDIDNINKMFDPTATHVGGESGGIKEENLSTDFRNFINNLTGSYVKVSDVISRYSDMWEMLCDLMDNYSTIDIDTDISVTVGTTYELTRNLTIAGNKTLTVISSLQNIIKITQPNLQVELKNLGLDLRFAGYLFSGDGVGGYQNLDIDYFGVKNTTITGSGQVCCFYVHVEDANKRYVRTVEILDNKIFDLTMTNVHLPDFTDPNNWQSYGLFIVENVSGVSILFENNTITETGRSICQFKDRNLDQDRSLVIIRNNKLVNSDAVWGDNTYYHMYYVFAMAEAYKVVYEKNYVEGMKIKTKTPAGHGAGVYDCYAKATHYICCDNVSKNNRIFYSSGDMDEEDIWLIKCKHCYNVLAKNNSFIIEVDFIERNITEGMDHDAILYDPAFIIDSSSLQPHYKWEVFDNNFDVPYVAFEGEQLKGSIYNFVGNTIKCKQIQGYIYYTGGENTCLDLKINRNKIFASEANVNNFRILHSVGLVTEAGQNAIEIVGNLFDVPNMYNGVGEDDNDKYSRYFKCKSFIFRDNICYVSPQFHYIFGDVIYEGNKQLKSSLLPKYGFSPHITASPSNVARISDSFEVNSLLSFSITIGVMAYYQRTPMKMIIRVKLCCADGTVEDQTFVINYSYDSGTNKIIVNGTEYDPASFAVTVTQGNISFKYTSSYKNIYVAVAKASGSPYVYAEFQCNIS